MIPPDPGSVLAMWAAGLAGGASVVAFWRVARPGFVVLAIAVTAAIGGLGALSGAGVWAAAATALALTTLAVRKSWLAAIPLGLAALAWWWSARLPIGAQSAALGALALGAITSEMLLGHWFLVDPRLPRWPLKRLALAGIVAMIVEAVLIGTGGGSEIVSGLVLSVLAVTTVLLMVAVYFSLQVRSYTGVMAATGLSYLATLTCLAAVILSRAGV